MIVPIVPVSSQSINQIQSNISQNNIAQNSSTNVSANIETNNINQTGGSTQIINSHVKASDLFSTEPMNPMNSGASAEMMSNVYKVISKSEVDRSQISSLDNKADVEKIKQEMTPSYEISTDMKVRDNANDSIVAMSKTFDHAMFVAMVTQVASGVSNSLRMLIRQS